MMKKIYQISFIVVFLLILIVPLAFINTEKEYLSEFDNRYLTEFPEISLDNTEFSTQVETYLTDRIGGRNLMIKASAKMDDLIFQTMIHSNYQYGKDGYIFSKIDYQASDDYIADFSSFICKVNEYCQERGTPFIFMLNPSKYTVYPEYMPVGMDIDYNYSETIIEYLESNGVDCYYSKDDLVALKDTETPGFNKKYDAGHWNNDGAYVACSALIDKLRAKNQKILPIDPNNYVKETVIQKTVPASYFPINEEYVEYKIKDKNGIACEPKTLASFEYADCLDYSKSYDRIRCFTGTSEDSPTLMVFKGSYFSEGRYQFIFPSFSDSAWIHAYHNLQRFDYFYNLFKPDIVIFETAEYVINPIYYNQLQLNSADFNPVISTFDSAAAEDFAQVTPVDFTSLSDAAKLCSDPALTVKYTLSGAACKYAYLTVNGEVFDFEISSEGGVQTLSIAVKTDKVKAAESCEITLISADEQKKCIIPIAL